MPLFTKKFHEYVALNDIATLNFNLVCVDKSSRKMLKLNKAYVHTYCCNYKTKTFTVNM